MANKQYLSPFNYNLINNKRIKTKIYSWFISCFFSLFLYIITFNFVYTFIVAIFATFLIKEFYLRPIKTSFKTGYDGEKKCLQILNKLPKQFIIFNQIEIPSNKSTFNEFETDFIVLGKNNVFIIEVKNYYGKIECEHVKNDWLRLVPDANGKIIKHDIVKSPYVQLTNQKYILLNFLQEFGLQFDVNTVIYLDMNKKDIHIPVHNSIPVFTDKKIVRYLKNIDSSQRSFSSKDERDLLEDILISLNFDSIQSRKTRLRNKKFLKTFLE